MTSQCGTYEKHNVLQNTPKFQQMVVGPTGALDHGLSKCPVELNLAGNGETSALWSCTTYIRLLEEHLES